MLHLRSYKDIFPLPGLLNVYYFKSTYSWFLVPSSSFPTLIFLRFLFLSYFIFCDQFPRIFVLFCGSTTKGTKHLYCQINETPPSPLTRSSCTWSLRPPFGIHSTKHTSQRTRVAFGTHRSTNQIRIGAAPKLFL
jgi:hypothetical protein